MNRPTFFEGRVVIWSEHPSFLLPAEKQISPDEMNKRAREAFIQEMRAPDPNKSHQTAVASLSELQKIRSLLG